MDITKSGLDHSMKIQFLNGGLANQAFQYIFAKYYELSHPGNIMYMDDTYFALNTVHNGYELEKVFGIKANMLSSCFSYDEWQEILKEKAKGKSVPQIFKDQGKRCAMIAETSKYNDWNPFDGQVMAIPCNGYFPEILEVKGLLYYHGYWINSKWFKQYEDVFLEEFSFPELTSAKNQEYMKQIQEYNSVSIHIRRGDYVTLGWAMEESMYRKLTELYVKAYSADWTVFVFSDDIEWCRKHKEELGLGVFADAVFVEDNVNGNNYIDMQLMSNCKGMIMSNSAFCYLAALLNRNKDFIINCSGREI